jgi:aminoglycoside phosphotransferase (APT) family kinase protein
MQDPAEESIDTPLPGLDVTALSGWMDAALNIRPGEQLVGQLIVGGRSNLTYLVTAGSRQWVLRRPPLGRRLPTAHDMSREVKVLKALSGTEVPVPAIVGECTDENVIGAPFYVMEYVDGRVIRSASDLDLPAADRHAIGLALAKTLAHLHRLDYQRIGLASLGRPDGYVARQVHRWQQQLDQSRVRELPLLDRLGRMLAASVPVSSGAAVLHGDYRLDNVILDREHPESVIAVLDWEMATLGDPRCDLGMLLMYWGEPGERFATQVHAITAAAGFPSRREVVETYAREVGAEPIDLPFFVALAYFKLAVIVEGIHARFLDGLTVGDGYEQMEAVTPVLAEQGLEALT